MMFNMKQLFVMALVLIEMTGSYPSSSNQNSLDECHNCLASNLPKEILTKIFQNLDSFRDLNQCSQACTSWETGVVANSKYIYRHFSNHELVTALIHGLPAHLSTIVPSPTILAHIFEYLRPKIPELCSADKYLFTIRAVEYGDIETLEKLFEQEYDLTLLLDPEGTLARFESNPFLKNIDKAHEDSVKWLWDKLVQWETTVVSTHPQLIGRFTFTKVDLNMAAIKAGYDVDAPENLFFVDHFLIAAQQGPNLSLFEKYAKLALESGLSPDRVWNATASCRSCNGEQLQRMVHFYQHDVDETVLQEKMSQALYLACARGSFEMVKYLRENIDSFDPISCIQLAVWNTNFDLVSELKQESPEMDLYFQSKLAPSVLKDMIRRKNSYRYNMIIVSLLEYLTKEYNREIFSSIVPAAKSRYLLNVYAGYVCGNEVGLETFGRLCSLLSPAEVESSTAINLIHRSQMPTGGPNNRYCRPNETSQILEYVLDKNYFTPTQEDLNIAFKTGRLDVVKWIYSKGRENGAPLVINSHSLLEMLAKTPQDHSLTRGWQSPELLNYVLEKAFGGPLDLEAISDADKQIVRQFIDLTRDEIPVANSTTARYDCYYEIAKDLIKLE